MWWEVREGDAATRLREMADESVQCCVTSPPYFGLRDYGIDGQIGLEPTPDEFVTALVDVFREVRRVLRGGGTLWLNLGDGYGNGKNLLGVPWAAADALKRDGWILRSDIIWSKPNPMPESVKDRPTSAHEHIFLLAKSARYYYDVDAIREPHLMTSWSAKGDRAGTTLKGQNAPTPKGVVDDGRAASAGIRGTSYHPKGRNRRNVWDIPTQTYAGAHFATYPPKLIEPCILAGSAAGDVVLDPFTGAGTTGLVALRHGRSFVGIELNPAYAAIARERIRDDSPLVNVAIEAA